ncbi:uncharacterized protein TNCV_2366621 [Trichonephila clavipes]|nr:uncharacterized protein TNCV_2366621 [Trichonephila clavipes]
MLSGRTLFVRKHCTKIEAQWKLCYAVGCFLCYRLESFVAIPRALNTDTSYTILDESDISILWQSYEVEILDSDTCFVVYDIEVHFWITGSKLSSINFAIWNKIIAICLINQCRGSRAHQTALARFRSDHLRSMTFVQGVKSFFTCPYSLLASPAHILDSCGISLRQLYEEQDLVCGTIMQKGQMEIV